MWTRTTSSSDMCARRTGRPWSPRATRTRAMWKDDNRVPLVPASWRACPSTGAVCARSCGRRGTMTMTDKTHRVAPCSCIDGCTSGQGSARRCLATTSDGHDARISACTHPSRCLRSRRSSRSRRPCRLLCRAPGHSSASDRSWAPPDRSYAHTSPCPPSHLPSPFVLLYVLFVSFWLHVGLSLHIDVAKEGHS
ncbi:hypothetical protein AMAG_07976 [Allomyces macrogynus ATCC 38327]|uniref:Uncharacterized protein n=1 Tax=Allomyces macrogynus (strain ATCC 38327) TaxID=578462 RepID=A0A0L0SJY6_ALLM3|nr:hypothetical protein AMAG_07976 [Allomyces macrogynus ATCC 38327]|eukprot:KNE62793.1 hypothetical protein AMAG_07976 [Allomyces macrogynus ATCC 38327]